MFTRRGTVRRRDGTAGRRVNIKVFQNNCTWVDLLVIQYCTLLCTVLCTVLYSTVYSTVQYGEMASKKKDTVLYCTVRYKVLGTLCEYLNGIDEAGESTLSEIVSLYIVFSHLLIIVIVY